MNPPRGDLTLPVVPTTSPHRHAPVALPTQPWLFAVFMGVASAVAAVLGIVLGVLAATEAGIGATRWSEVVQAHGRIQLFGFAAPFAVALALEFMPRLNQQPAVPRRERLSIPAIMLLGAVTLGTGQAAGVGWLAWPGVGAFGAGTAWFALVALRFPTPRTLAVDPQPLYFKAAAAWLAASALLAAWGVAATEGGVVPLDLSRAIAETFLRGFIMLLIAGVAIRAFPGHLGLPPMSIASQRLLFAAFNASLTLWLASSGPGGLGAFEPGIRIADVLFAAAIVGFTSAIGLPRTVPFRRGSPRYAYLIPLAWFGVLAYAALITIEGIVGGSDNLYGEGARRHVFMLGFMLPLMLAMAHIVLARFGTGVIPWENLLTAAFVAVLVAWPLRVVPVLISETPSDGAKGAMGLGGVFAAAGLAAAAVVCFRVAINMRAAASPQRNLVGHRHER